MKAFRFFVTFLMVAVCAMVVTSCSDDDEPTNETLIVGKWKSMESGYTDEILELKSDGNFTYHYTNDGYSEDGKYKIESDKLYMMWLEDDEPEWNPCKIHELNSTSLVIEEYDNKGNLRGKKDIYQRIN